MPIKQSTALEWTYLKPAQQHISLWRGKKSLITFNPTTLHPSFLSQLNLVWGILTQDSLFGPSLLWCPALFTNLSFSDGTSYNLGDSLMASFPWVSSSLAVLKMLPTFISYVIATVPSSLTTWSEPLNTSLHSIVLKSRNMHAWIWLHIQQLTRGCCIAQLYSHSIPCERCPWSSHNTNTTRAVPLAILRKVILKLCIRMTWGVCCNYGFWAPAPSPLSFLFPSLELWLIVLGPFLKSICGDSNGQSGWGINNIT